MKYNRKQEIVQIAIDKIKPYPGNPRINEQAVPALMENIRKMGFRNPLYLAPDLTIIAGHTRLKAARALGMSEVDCIIVSDLTEAEMREMRLSDNRLSEFAKWDLGLLHEEVEWLEDDGADLEYLDLDEFELDTDKGVDIDASDFGESFVLPDGERSSIRQITFTLHEQQLQFIEEVLKTVEPSEDFGNTNEKGNKLYEVVKRWAMQRA